MADLEDDQMRGGVANGPADPELLACRRRLGRDPSAMTDDGDKRSMDQRLAGLTAAQRDLLVQRLMERRMDAARQNAISARQDDGPAPLSYAQELLWLLSQVFDDGIAYNAPGSFQLKGSLDMELLERALTALVERHSILRTTYLLID